MAYSGSDSESSAELFSEDSDDDIILNFVQHLARPRKIPRLQIRKDNFHYWDDDEFYRRFRLSKQTVVHLLEQISDVIKHPTDWNHALTPMEMLLITLRFYASGSFLIVVGDFASVHRSTAGRVIDKVTQAIAALRVHYIKFPDTEAEQNVIKQVFYNIALFPRVVGALDCTHVKIKSPGGRQAEIFRNRKNFFSFNIQTVCDATLKIMDIVARWPGSVHDTTIFHNSQLCRRFENNEINNAVLLADGGYPVKKYLLTPLAQTNTRGENLYNEAQIRTRNPVERSYGVWKRRFPILSNGINMNIAKVQRIVVATAVLHNIAINNNEDDPPQLNPDEAAAFDEVNDVPVDLIQNINNNFIRNEIITYFENLG